MISVVWTRNGKIGSKIIRWCTRSRSSHVAIVLDHRLTMHSTFARGVHLQWYHNFCDDHQIVGKLDFADWSLEQEEAVYQRLIDMEYRPYDFMALIYLGISYISHRLFNTELIRKNRWSSPSADICIELIRSLEAAGLQLGSLDTISTDDLYYILKGKADGHISNSRA